MKRIKHAIMHGDEAINMASHIIHELHGLNDLRLEEWIDYEEIDYLIKCATPHRKTLLHNYIEYIYDFGFQYTLDKHFPMEVIENLVELFNFYGIDYSSAGNFEFNGITDDDLDGDELREAEEFAEKAYEIYQQELMPVVVDDIFTVLYSDKNFLYEFNRQLSQLIRSLTKLEYPDYLKKDGVLERCSFIPQWLKNGVFYRDKGRCQICGADLTKILQLDNKDNYDHIIPLENGGTNEPTNFQLTCEHCNKSKGAKNSKFNNMANRFWELDSYELFDDV